MAAHSRLCTVPCAERLHAEPGGRCPGELTSRNRSALVHGSRERRDDAMTVPHGHAWNRAAANRMREDKANGAKTRDHSVGMLIMPFPREEHMIAFSRDHTDDFGQLLADADVGMTNTTVKIQ